MSEKNPFADVPQYLYDHDGGGNGWGGLGGVLGGDGLNGIKVSTQLAPPGPNTPGGLELHYPCSKCSKRQGTLVEFPELIAIKYNVAPQVAYGNLPRSPVTEPTQWGYEQGGFFPAINCDACGYNTKILVTPHEADTWLSTALHKRYLAVGMEQQLSQHCAGVAQAMMRQQQTGMVPRR